MFIDDFLENLKKILQSVSKTIGNMEKSEIVILIETKAEEAGINPKSYLFKEGLATLKGESGLKPNAVCFNLKRSSLSGVLLEGNIVKTRYKEYRLDKDKKTLQDIATGAVIVYNTWDRGIAQFNSYWWPQVTDDMAFTPEIALEWFWIWFPRNKNWWLVYKSGAYRNHL